MSIMVQRGGVPCVVRATAPTTGLVVTLPQPIFHLKIRVGTAPCKVYFTEADYTNDVNYVLIPIPAADAPYGEWEGPVELPTHLPPTVWLKGSGASSAVELVAFMRRA